MRLTISLCLMLCLSGCLADPKDSFKDFEKRVAAKIAAEADAASQMMTDGGGSDCEPATMEQLAGFYFLATIPSFAKQYKLFNTVRITPMPGSTTEAKLEIQFLTKDEPHMPTGDVNETTIALDGASFRSKEIEIAAPQDALPVPLANARTKVAYKGTVCKPEGEVLGGFCGTSDGAVTAPTVVPYKDSLFGAVRIEDDANLPAPVASCDEWSKIQ